LKLVLTMTPYPVCSLKAARSFQYRGGRLPVDRLEAGGVVQVRDGGDIGAYGVQLVLDGHPVVALGVGFRRDSTTSAMRSMYGEGRSVSKYPAGLHENGRGERAEALAELDFQVEPELHVLVRASPRMLRFPAPGAPFHPPWNQPTPSRGQVPPLPFEGVVVFVQGEAGSVSLRTARTESSPKAGPR
jgi:hypothetical protein